LLGTISYWFVLISTFFKTKMPSSKQRSMTLGVLAIVLSFFCLISPMMKYDSSTRFLVGNEDPQLPLVYPFFICQFGRPRSATTFQVRLLRAISNLKSPTGITVPLIANSHLPDVTGTDSELLAGVMKTHTPEVGLECIERGYPVFTSDRPGNSIGENWDNKFKTALHRQDMTEMENCSLCQVDYYQPIFDLSDDEVAILKDYMSLYEKIRQCCGSQMSKYNRARLHGCDTSSFRDLPKYPNCEENNLEEIEQLLHKHIIKVDEEYPEINWVQPGDCAKFDKLIIGGNDFNNKKWNRKCPVVVNGVDTKVKMQ